MEKGKIINYVYETYDYDKFRVMDKGNREIDHDRKIAASMNVNFLFSPILVNEKMEIIDGQNRFMAAKSLGKPVYYIVKNGYGIEEVRTLNTNSKNWGIKDFIKSYADMGKEDYVKIVRFMDNYPDFPTSIIVQILMCNETGGAVFKTISSGTFKVKNLAESERIVQMLLAYEPFHKDIYRRKSFISAIIKLSKKQQFDNDEVIRKIQLYPRMFVPCVDTADYIKMIEEIVNYRRKGGKIWFNV